MNFENIWGRLKELGGLKLGFLGGGMLFLVALSFFLMSRINQPDMVLLYGDLEIREGGQITEKLQSLGVSFEVKEGGKQVYVPVQEVLKLRMTLAEAGLPTGGTVGYEIFDRSDVLGSTSFIQNVNLLRAVEGELSRTIRSIQGVAAARVHVVLPQRTLFAKDRQKPTAAVVLKMRSGSARLASSQVHAIQHLVASSVPELSPEHISILDDRGVLLASGVEKEGNTFPLAMEEARIMYETRLGRMIESLLEQSVGPGKVRAEVTVDLDMDRVTEQAEIFDPDSQVARSTQNSSDTHRSTDGAANAPTSVQTNVPNVSGGTAGAGSGGSSETQKTEETTNYEISKTVKTAVKEMGGVKRLSVAVVVDGKYEKNAEGKEQYKPREAPEIDQLSNLVKAVVGFQQKRGDVVNVVNLQFVNSEFLSEDDGFLSQIGLHRRDWVRIIEAAILGLVVLIIFLFVFKPYMGRVLGGEEGLSGAMAAGGSMSMGVKTPLMPGVPGSQELAPSLRDLPSQNTPSTGEEKALFNERLQRLQSVEDMIKQQPENAALIMRIWMKR